MVIMIRFSLILKYLLIDFRYAADGSWWWHPRVCELAVALSLHVGY